jgi:hypothetical protein
VSVWLRAAGQLNSMLDGLRVVNIGESIAGPANASVLNSLFGRRLNLEWSIFDLNEMHEFQG